MKYCVGNKCEYMECGEHNSVAECMWCPERSLSEWLRYNKVDQITDDEEFCTMEHDVVMDYCRSREFCLSEEDMETIRTRGLEEDFEANRNLFEEENETENNKADGN